MNNTEDSNLAYLSEDEYYFHSHLQYYDSPQKKKKFNQNYT